MDFARIQSAEISAYIVHKQLISMLSTTRSNGNKREMFILVNALHNRKATGKNYPTVVKRIYSGYNSGLYKEHQI